MMDEPDVGFITVGSKVVVGESDESKAETEDEDLSNNVNQAETKNKT